MVDKGVERTSAKFGSLEILCGRASACELPLRRRLDGQNCEYIAKKRGAPIYLKVKHIAYYYLTVLNSTIKQLKKSA